MLRAGMSERGATGVEGWNGRHLQRICVAGGRSDVRETCVQYSCGVDGDRPSIYPMTERR